MEIKICIIWKVYVLLQVLAIHGEEQALILLTADVEGLHEGDLD
jgi:hypothetical protein